MQRNMAQLYHSRDRYLVAIEVYMKSDLRIAVGGIQHETNTFSPIWTTWDDFTILQGEAALQDGLEPSDLPAGVVLLPASIARAMPGGLVQKATYLRLKDALLHELEGLLPVDGVYLRLHGAMEVEEIGDGESDLVTAVRDLVGPQVLISVSLDLHANITPKVVESADILTAFRTAPHRDERETWQRAVNLLVRALREDLRPQSALVKLPLLLPGEAAITDVEPTQSLYQRLPELDTTSGIMDTSILIGCAWTDSAATSVSVIAVASAERSIALETATQLGAEIWARRHDFSFSVEVASVDDAIQLALNAQVYPVFISDSGDNVTAGGAGDIPVFVERLLAVGATSAVVAGLADSEAVQRCAEAGVGSRVELSLGGKLDQDNGKPLSVSGIVEHISVEPEGEDSIPATALVRINGIRVIIARDRRAFTTRASIVAAGINPMAKQLVVVKLGYLFPDLADHAPRAIMALSNGATNLQLAALPYQKLQRPIFPLDPDCVWPSAEGPVEGGA